MTAPVLHQLAGWDVARLRGGVGRLGQVADRLVPWQLRLDALGRRLAAAECWSGPAGTVAAAALVELSSVSSRVSGGLDASLPGLTGLVAAAEEAQEAAVAALTAADAAGAGWGADGQPTGLPGPPTAATAPDQAAAVLAARDAGRVAAAQAEVALAAAARAASCAGRARQPLAAVTRLVAPGGPAVSIHLVPPPTGAVPGAVAAWWAGLTAAEQLATADRWPGAVGALDGLPGWARDRANRTALAAALVDLPPGSPGEAMAQAVVSALATVEGGGRVAQLLQFDPSADLVAVSVGDVDTAAALAVLVPGIYTTPEDDLTGLVGSAGRVLAAAAAAAPAVAAAAVVWLGYRTPTWKDMATLGPARRGGRALDAALDGMAAARGSSGGTRPRTTVVAHSYGTVVTGVAARAPGRLAADAVVLLGSPGVAGRAADLEADEVYGAWTPWDPISSLGWFGDSPSGPFFGDEPLPVELTEGHTDYLDPDRPTLAAIGEVVAGVGDGG